VRNDEVRVTTRQPRLSATVQVCHLSVFGYIARVPDETDAKKILAAFPSENWRRPSGRSRAKWIETIWQDLRFGNISLNGALDVAQNRPHWIFSSIKRLRKRNHTTDTIQYNNTIQDWCLRLALRTPNGACQKKEGWGGGGGDTQIGGFPVYHYIIRINGIPPFIRCTEKTLTSVIPVGL